MKKSEIRKLDILWSKAIKEKYGYKCAHCGRTDRKLESAHIVGRADRSTRWRLDNGINLCFVCHSDYDQHRNNMETWVISHIGQEKWNELQTAHHQSITKNQDYEVIKESLSAIA